ITVKPPSGRLKKGLYDIRPDVLNFLRNALDALQELLLGPGKPVLTAPIQSAFEALILSAARELEKLYPPLLSAADEPNSSPTIPSDVGETSRANTPLPQARLSPQLSRHSQVPTPGEKPTSAAKPQRAHGDARTQAPRPPAAADRIAGLARKDALWYLCSVLHITIPPAALGSSPPPGSPNTGLPPPDASTLLREGVCTVLAGLLRRTVSSPRIHVSRTAPAREGDDPSSEVLTEGGEGCSDRGLRESRFRGRLPRGLLGAVEREMLLAVAERLWLSQG
ncbi:uncharacterized protein PHACADRAFT_82004, partial [Phanerochaete carnosa HHB-10118-sp]